MTRLSGREDHAALRKACVAALNHETKRILVCAGTGCVSSGSMEIFERLRTLMQERNIPVSVELEAEPHGERVGLKECGCHGFCEMGPLLRVEPQGWLYTKTQLSDCEEIVTRTVQRGEWIERLAYQKNGAVYAKRCCADSPATRRAAG